MGYPEFTGKVQSANADNLVVAQRHGWKTAEIIPSSGTIASGSSERFTFTPQNLYEGSEGLFADSMNIRIPASATGGSASGTVEVRIYQHAEDSDTNPSEIARFEFGHGENCEWTGFDFDEAIGVSYETLTSKMPTHYEGFLTAMTDIEGTFDIHIEIVNNTDVSLDKTAIYLAMLSKTRANGSV